MKKHLLYSIFFVAFFAKVSAQLQGETDMVSRPVDYFGFVFQDENARPFAPVCNDFQNYACGFNWGYYYGYEDGLSDANKCQHGATFAGAGFPGEVGLAWLDGYYAAWSHGYQEGYEERIAQKSATCTSPYYFDDFFCECRCEEERYEYDGDNDGYYNANRFSQYACVSPGRDWKLFSRLSGIDCNDSNPNIWNYNECGLCTEEDGITQWYYDSDGDKYHSSIIFSCSWPGTSHSLSTKGEDCDDKDMLANVNKRWYYFGDADNYYGTSKMSCERPTAGDPSKWRTSTGSGQDCDDSNPDIIGEVKRYYDYDGDGYYGQSEFSCFPPEEWEDGRWSTDPGKGKDCDDNNEDAFVVDACHKCGGDGSPILAYWDLDQDGYYSIEMHEVCMQSEFVSSKRFSLSLEYLESLGIPREAFVPAPEGYEFHTEISSPSSFVSLQEGSTTRTFKHGDFDSKVPLKPPYDQYFDWQGVTILFAYTEPPLAFTAVFGSDIVPLSQRFGTYPNKPLGKDCDDFNPDILSFGDFYADRDRDGYHDPSVDPIVNTCQPPDDGYVLLPNSLGEDCDDNDKWANAERIWYYSKDLDEYYSKTFISCENPAKDTDEAPKWQTDKGEGLDCDDNDANATFEKNWYLDRDGDGYYIDVRFQCSNPGRNTPDELLWKVDADEGLDCDDTLPEIFRLNACGTCIGELDPPNKYYLDLDGDGYHSAVKQEDCGLPFFMESLFTSFEIFDQIQVQEVGSHSITLSSGETIVFETKVNADNQVEYHFPNTTFSMESLGLDCDDLNPDTKANGSWYPDRDGDGYHNPAISPTQGCSPPDDDYILLAHSNGADCDDDEAAYTEIRTWYRDLDGDGYFVDYVDACYSPGFGWSQTSNAGPDNDDTNPFVPFYSSQEFIIPSLIKTEEINSVTYIEYLGITYPLDEFSIVYRGVELSYEDILYDRVAPSQRIVANTLLSGSQAALYHVQILQTRAEASAARTAEETTDPRVERTETQWIKKIRENAPEGYSSNTWAEISFGKLGDPDFDEEALSYFDELFDPAKFDAFTNHYRSFGGTDLTIAVASVDETISEDIDAPHLKKFGEGEPDVVVHARKTVDHRVEFVILVRDEVFIPTRADLQNNTKWLNADNSWKDPSNEAIFNQQVGEIKTFREFMPLLLATDFRSGATTFDPPTAIAGLRPERMPSYDYGTFGFFTKLYEFYDIGRFTAKNGKMPRGVWDDEYVPGNPAYEEDEASPEEKLKRSAGRWKTKSPSSLGGITDRTIEEVTQYADMIKMCKSLVYRETWSQILESVQRFSLREQLNGMLDTFDDRVAELRGDKGENVQYYSIGTAAAGTFIAVASAWKTIARRGAKLIGIKQLQSPVNPLKRKFQDFGENFRGINKFSRFINLPKEAKKRLMKDISESRDGVLGEALAKNNGELLKAWKKLDDDLGDVVSNSVKRGVRHLSIVKRWIDEGIELTFESIEEGAKVLNKNGNEVGRLIKRNSEELFEISDDFIVDAATSSGKVLADAIKIVGNTGEPFVNPRFIKLADGSLGFVEDVASFGSKAVQSTIKKRGALRKALKGIKATEDAHHIIPVQLLKQNSVVKKAVEAGFEFNSTKNGLAIEKFVKKTGVGRHGPHPKYTEQINQALERFRTQTPNYTNQQAKEFLEIITDDIKNTIRTTSGKINDLSLGL